MKKLKAWQLVIEPNLALLKPKAIVTLRKKTGNLVEKLYKGDQHMCCVPRTMGDSWVSEEGRIIHSKMRSELL